MKLFFVDIITCIGVYAVTYAGSNDQQTAFIYANCTTATVLLVNYLYIALLYINQDAMLEGYYNVEPQPVTSFFEYRLRLIGASVAFTITALVYFLLYIYFIKQSFLCR